MSNALKLLLAAGAIVAFSAFQKVNASGSLNFYPASINQITFDGMTPVANIGLAIQNPSNQQFVIHSIAGNVYANDYLIGNVSSYINQTIKANSQAVYNLNIRFSILGIVNDIIRSFENKSGINQILELQANINVDNFTIPLKVKYKVP